ncbi:6306_t:CDS:2 [Funneliformis geosporum]|nr:6306_t:CDS:2 [Funneliformis geosporum]
MNPTTVVAKPSTISAGTTEIPSKDAMNPTTVVAKPSTISAGTTEIPSKDGTGACSIM